jgi:DNA-binding beta-propeller fold protein YncE
VVPALLEPQGPNAGAISPDGTTVVVVSTDGQGGEAVATLVELDNGASRPIDLPLTPTGGEGTIVWSPDGRRLFAVDASQQLKVIDARTLAVADLVPGLPSIRQLVIRS